MNLELWRKKTFRLTKAGNHCWPTLRGLPSVRGSPSEDIRPDPGYFLFPYFYSLSAIYFMEYIIWAIISFKRFWNSYNRSQILSFQYVEIQQTSTFLNLLSGNEVCQGYNIDYEYVNRTEFLHRHFFQISRLHFWHCLPRTRQWVVIFGTCWSAKNWATLKEFHNRRLYYEKAPWKDLNRNGL